MSDVHDMSDRELNEAVAAEVMGLTVVGWWPVLEAVVPGGTRLLPILFVNPSHMTISISQWRKLYIDEAAPMRLEPFLRGARCNHFGEVVPAYTTDARETEKVMALLVQKGHHLKGIHSPSATTVTVFLRQAGEDVSAVTAKHADWKRAVCEAALLAVRGAR